MERISIPDAQARELLVTGQGVIVNAAKLEALMNEVPTLRAELAAARERLATAEADSRRYQYLRTASLIHWETGRKRNRISFPTIIAAEPVEGGNFRDRFDAAIDAAGEQG